MARIAQRAAEDEDGRRTGHGRCRMRRSRNSRWRPADQWILVNRLLDGVASQPRRELEAAGRRTLEKDPRRRIRSFQPFERADNRVRRVASPVAIEVEAAIPVPVVAASVDAPAGARVTAADHEIAPVVDE